MPAGALAFATIFASNILVTTETPHALCPPLAEAQAAVDARVGEVTDGPYQLRYRLIRNRRAGRNELHLELTDSAESLLLERTLPFSDRECSDAAQAVALVVDSYFQNLESRTAAEPEEAPTSPEPRRSPPPEEREPVEVAPSMPSRDVVASSESKPPSRPKRRSFLVRGGLGIGSSAAPGLAFGAEWGAARNLSLSLEALWPLAPSHHGSPYEFTRETHSLFGAVGYRVWSSKTLSLKMGTDVSLQHERLELTDPGTDAGKAKTRWLPGLGGWAGLSWSLSAQTSLILLGRGGAALGGIRFTVEKNDGTDQELLPLPRARADGSVQFAFHF